MASQLARLEKSATARGAVCVDDLYAQVAILTPSNFALEYRIAAAVDQNYYFRQRNVPVDFDFRSMFRPVDNGRSDDLLSIVAENSRGNGYRLALFSTLQD